MVRGKSKPVSILLPALFAAVLVTCTSPDKVSGPGKSFPNDPEQPPPTTLGPPASIEVSTTLGDLFVNESRTLVVLVKDSAGHLLSGLSPTFTSSDTSIVKVSSAGVVQARWPGTARIEVAVGSVSKSVGAIVGSRVKIGLELVADWSDPIELALGDTVGLKAYYTDANGHYVNVRPTVTWSSTNPEGVSVDSEGMLTALKDGATAEIRAIGPEGVGIKNVKVSVPLSGPPATIRFANAIAGIGPITFVPTKGSAKTLRPGESATLQVSPGIFLVHAKVESDPFRESPSVDGMTIKGGEKVTIYAVGNPAFAALRKVWTYNTAIPPTTAIVDVISGATPGYPVIYIQHAGNPLDGLPTNCYFDWTDITGWEGAPGPLDLFLLDKYPDTQVRAHLQVEAKAGVRTTVVLAGTRTNGITYFSFPDL